MIATVCEDTADLSTNSGLGVLWTTVNNDVRPRAVSQAGSTRPQYLHDLAFRCDLTNKVAPSSTYSTSKINITVRLAQE
jgi:hypothetical protein